MTGRTGKSGQIAVFLVLILAGLVMLFALNVDIFVSSRAKTRIQNAADASALALARWQGATLNLIGDLNIAHLAAVCASNETAAAGIVRLQKRVALMGPTAGFKAAQDIAGENGIPVSRNMSRAAGIISDLTDAECKTVLDRIIVRGIRAGIDNASVSSAGNSDLRTDPEFYAAVKNRDFRALCLWFGGGRHSLPDLPPGVPDPEEFEVSPVNAPFGSVGISFANGTDYISKTASLAAIADECGYGSAVTAAGLASNAFLLASHQWCEYDQDEWRRLPDALQYPRFPWLTPLQTRYDTCGGAATVRIEGSVEMSSIAAKTNDIAAQAAAKALGSVHNGRVADFSPPLVLPSFRSARLVPFGVGAANRSGMADIRHVRSLMGLYGIPGGSQNYLNLLEQYRSEGFRASAEAWYSVHGHRDADGCHPPHGHGTEHGGGTPYGI